MSRRLPGTFGDWQKLSQTMCMPPKNCSLHPFPMGKVYLMSDSHVHSVPLHTLPSRTSWYTCSLTIPFMGSHSNITVLPITFFVHIPTGLRRVCSGHQKPESSAAFSVHVVFAVYTKLTVNSKQPSTYSS